MVAKLTGAEPQAAFLFDAALAAAPPSCQLQPYPKIKVPSFQVTGDFIAYASPDSTFAVTKNLLDAARKSILIGIYDFTAGYIRELLLKALQRGVQVSLMLDLDGRKGERDIFDDLRKHGCKAVAAPSCHGTAHYFAVSHEKVIVVDNTWTLVQSGNYTPDGIPQNEQDGASTGHFVPGNRDMGIAINSRPLATFFTSLLQSDMNLECEAEDRAAAPAALAPPAVELFGLAPSEVPSQLFHSKHLNPTDRIKVLPVLTPDNYLDVIPPWLATATKSIYIEQQYIHTWDSDIRQLLQSIAQAKQKRPALDVRIVLAGPLGSNDLPKLIRTVHDLDCDFGLRLGVNVRLLNPKQFVHCHNKLVIVDKQQVLVSSQNWSEPAVTKNREAGLVLYYPELARYYATIFGADWESAVQTLPKQVKAELFSPEALPTGKLVPLSLGDYVEV